MTLSDTMTLSDPEVSAGIALSEYELVMVKVIVVKGYEDTLNECVDKATLAHLYSRCVIAITRVYPH